MTFPSKKNEGRGRVWSFPGHKEGERWHVLSNPFVFPYTALKKKAKYEPTEKEGLEESN